MNWMNWTRTTLTERVFTSQGSNEMEPGSSVMERKGIGVILMAVCALVVMMLGLGCEQGTPTSPTSSLTQSGALATDAQGQVTSLTAAGAGDIQQARGGKPGPPGGRDDDKVTYRVEAVALGCADGNAWVATNGESREGLFARWPDDLTVTTVAPGGGVSLTGRASANVILGKKPFDKVATVIKRFPIEHSVGVYYFVKRYLILLRFRIY